MLHTTTWRPDTCGCTIEYEWDDTQSEDERVHTATRLVKACPHHVPAAEVKGARNIAREALIKINRENQGKNRAIKAVLDQAHIDDVDIVQLENGTTERQFKKGLEPVFSFDANRNLELELKGKTKLAIAALRNNVNARKSELAIEIGVTLK